MEELKISGWSLSEEAIREFNETDAAKILESKDKLLSFALNTDLKEISIPILEQKLNRQEGRLRGPVVLQISKIRDTDIPKANEYSNVKNPHRLLRIFLTDGHGSCSGLEAERLSSLSLNTPPGTKILLKGEIEVEHGFLTLNNRNCQVLGGNVKKLVERWEINRDSMVKMKSRSVNRMGGEGPPPWVPFGKRIQGTKSVKDGNFKSLAPKAEKEGEDEEVKEEEAKFKEAREAQIAEAGGGASIAKKFHGAKPQIPAAGPSKNGDRKPLERPSTDSRSAPTSARNPPATFPEDRRQGSRGGRGGGRRGGRRNSDDDYDHIDPSIEVKAPSGPSTLFDFLPEPAKKAAAPYQAVIPERVVENEARNEGGRRGGRGSFRGNSREPRRENVGRGGGRGGRGGGDFRNDHRPTKSNNYDQPPPPPQQPPARNFGDRNRPNRNNYETNRVQEGMANMRLNQPQAAAGRYSQPQGGYTQNQRIPPARVSTASSFVPSNVNYPQYPMTSPQFPGTMVYQAAIGGSQWSPGQHCLAPWSDSNIYPAEVIGVAPTGMATVKYLEYNEIGELPASALIPLSTNQPPPPMRNQPQPSGGRTYFRQSNR